MNTAPSLEGLAAWLHCRASNHATSICANDPVVKAEIETLRAWACAVDTISSPAKVGEPEDTDRDAGARLRTVMTLAGAGDALSGMSNADVDACRFSLLAFLRRELEKRAKVGGDEREAFEVWWLSDVPEGHRVFAKNLLDGYGPDYAAAAGVADAWRTWQALAALSADGVDRKDAERYRAWRAAAVSNDVSFVKAVSKSLPYGGLDSKHWPTTSQWDAGVDAAIAAKTAKGDA